MPTIKTENKTYELPYESRGTKLDSPQKQRCEAEGGKWDEAAQKCIFPEPKKQFDVTGAAIPAGDAPERKSSVFQTPEELAKLPKFQGAGSGQVQVGGSYNAERGGFVANDGRFYPTSNPDFRPGQTDGTIKFNKDGTVTLSGADGKPVTLTREEYETSRGGAGALTNNVQQALTQPNQADLVRQNLIEQLQQQGLSEQEIASISQAPIDWGQAITAGFANIIPSAIGGAVGLGAAGAVATAPAGGAGGIPAAIAGGIGGAVVGFFNGIRSNLKAQQSGEIASTKKVLSAARQNIRQVRMLAQADPTKADIAVQTYNQQMNQVRRAHVKLLRETDGNLNSFMNDGSEDLVEFELFLQPGGWADLQGQRLQEILANGVPQTAEQILMQLQEEQDLYNEESLT